jgi:hypothetical protein
MRATGYSAARTFIGAKEALVDLDGLVAVAQPYFLPPPARQMARRLKRDILSEPYPSMIGSDIRHPISPDGLTLLSPR